MIINPQLIIMKPGMSFVISETIYASLYSNNTCILRGKV